MSTKHNLIQERLNLKRAPLDEWNTHEQLCLASAVACSGDQNWMSVSRAIKGIVNSSASRPADWFISKSCATQYGKLLESVDTPKRKKRTASERDQPIETPSTPVESLVKKLTTERIVELKKIISEEQQQYVKLLEEINFLQAASPDDARVQQMWADIEQEKIAKEREQVRYDQWLQEREAKKIEIERQWRPNYGLNKSPTVVKPPKIVEPEPEPQAVSQSAPTLVTLLDKKPLPTTSAEVAEVKDEDAELLADFNALIAGSEKFDDEDLMEDINAIIMNPEILEDKIVEPVKDVDEETEDQLKIKQLVEDFAAVPEEVEPVVEEPEVIQVPSDVEISNPASVETLEEVKEELPTPAIVDDKVLVISDESNDGKKDEEEEKIEKVLEKITEKEAPADVFQVDDSDEDVLFEDAKEHHDESAKEVEEVKEPEKVEEKTDSDDEVLETKVTRTSRKKAAESVKPETPTKSRDHSENDDNREVQPIRTRSRHSSVISSEPKSTFNFPKEQDHSMWKARWEDCVKDLQKLSNYASIVDNKASADDSYKSVILCPMNTKIIQKNIESHASTMPGDIKRDFALMCTNIIMLNKKGAKFNDSIHQFIKDGMEIIDDKMEVEDAYKSYRKQIKKKQ